MAQEVANPVSPAASLEAPPLPRISTFHSLRYKDFRYMWEGQLGHAASQWMEQLARPLLILQLTDSALMVGLVMATRMLPQLILGVWAGVIADRMDKRKILLISQSVTLATHFITAALILTGVIQPWMVFITTFSAGCSMAFNQPARQSIIPRIVPRESLANAVALNAAAVNIMRIGGPSLAGLILIFFDLGDLYLVQGVIYIWVMYSTWRITVRSGPEERKRSSMRAELFEGFAAVKTDKIIFYILLLNLVVFVWGMPYNTVFVPLITLDALDMGKSGVGILMSCVGVGALLGSLTIATVGDSVKRRGLLMLGQMTAFSFSLLVFSRSETLLIAIPALILSGATQTSFMALNNAYVLGRTPRDMQGRIMSLFSLDRGLVPLGAAIGGVLAETLGPQDGLLIMASVCLSCTAALALLVPSVRRIS